MLTHNYEWCYQYCQTYNDRIRKFPTTIWVSSFCPCRFGERHFFIEGTLQRSFYNWWVLLCWCKNIQLEPFHCYVKVFYLGMELHQVQFEITINVSNVIDFLVSIIKNSQVVKPKIRIGNWWYMWLFDSCGDSIWEVLSQPALILENHVNIGIQNGTFNCLHFSRPMGLH